jgi:carbon monoxide dehydrogenase subunit G
MTQRDEANHVAALEIRADDRRIGGGLTARTTFRLEPAGEGASTLAVATDAALLGRLGQFGQPIIKRKADELAREFAANLAAALRVAPDAG